MWFEEQENEHEHQINKRTREDPFMIKSVTFKKWIVINKRMSIKFQEHEFCSCFGMRNALWFKNISLLRVKIVNSLSGWFKRYL